LKTNKTKYFIGIGAQKSGTTWLYKRLQELPDLKLPLIKELHYFDRDNSYPSPNILSTNRSSKNEAYKIIRHSIIRIKFKSALWLYKWHFSEINDRWYLDLLGKNGIRGEITPSYAILTREDIQRMKSILPNAKIVFLVRNPIERAWSHYLHYLKINNLSTQSISPLDFIVTNNQVLRSDYRKTLNNYSSIFDQNQILIGFFDAIKLEPLQLMKNICIHIGYDETQVEKNCNLKEITHKSDNIKIPKSVYEYLKNMYEDDIRYLSATYGNYFSIWEQNIYGNKINTTHIDASIII
jgi:hypothetical protein